MAGSKAIVLGVGKVAVVAFALAAAGYLVVNAQRRANGPASASGPSGATAPAETVATPAATPEPVADAAAVAAPDAAAALVSEPLIEADATLDDPTFMLSTKVGVFTDMNESLLPAETTTEVEPQARPVYLEGSKSMRLDVQRVRPPVPAPGKP